MNPMADPGLAWDAPIVIIGPGRSGSTLVSEILAAHPEVNAVGETAFLLNRLWDTYYSRPTYVNEYRQRSLILNSRDEWRDMTWMQFLHTPPREPYDPQILFDTVKAAEEPRMAALLGKFIAESMIPPAVRRRYWSFQEIWNGCLAMAYGWQLHDLAYPKAKYLHVTRHPRTWLASYLSINNIAPTPRASMDALREWVRIQDTALDRAGLPGRYHLIRYEDLVAQTIPEMTKFMTFIGVEYHPRCAEAVKFKYRASADKIELPPISVDDIEGVPGLWQLMDRFAYDWGSA